MRKSIISCLLVAILALTALSVPLSSQEIFIDPSIRVAPDLNIASGTVREDLLAWMEKKFSDKGIVVVTDQSYSRFALVFTVTVKHFIKSAASYSVIFEVKHMKVVSTRYKGFIPPLAYEPFSSRDCTGGVTPAHDLDNAVSNSMKNLMCTMDRFGVFDFFRHPNYAKVIATKPSDLEKIKTRADLDRMADKIIKELKIAIDVSAKAKAGKIVVNAPPQKDYGPQLKKILKEIAGLKRDKNRPLPEAKKKLKENVEASKVVGISEYASIIIETNRVEEKFTSATGASIRPDPACTDCVTTQINAAKLGILKSKADFSKFAQEKSYRKAFPIKGRLVQVKKSKKWHILVAPDDFKTILEIDGNGKLGPGVLLKSLIDPYEIYPRILVRIGAHQ